MPFLGGITLKKAGAGDSKMLAGLANLRRERVLVGIPEDENNRGEKAEGPRLKGGGFESRSPIGNAALLFLHSEGSPARKLPQRQVIQPAIKAEDNKKRLMNGMKGVAQLEMAGDHEAALEQLAKVGIMGANASKRWFTDPRNGWPPNKRATVLRKLNKLTGQRLRKALAMLDAQGQAAVDTVLIDTGQMRRAITSVVDDGTTLEGAGAGGNTEAGEAWENAE
jgi:hypothetical protein